MCKFASFVLTKDREFWSDTVDSHSEIIATNSLHEWGSHGPTIVKVEISPTSKMKVWPSLKAWKFTIDQDELPNWADAETLEKRTRAALLRRYKKGFTTADLGGCTGLKEVSLPAATTANLSGCTGLKEVSLPAATTANLSGCTPDLVIKSKKGAIIIR